MKPIVMVHANPVRLQNDVLTVDRKFHDGMLRYASLIEAPIVTVNPALNRHAIMDAIEVSIAELPYRVAMPAALPALIDNASLIYGGGMGSEAMARAAQVPYIPILEYDLKTQITANASRNRNPLRQLATEFRIMAHYYRKQLNNWRGAHSLHCNGYPVYEAAAPYNGNRLLYLDSRMSAHSLISESDLEARLAKRPLRPLRLLYSGRYEPMKGALDAVKVGLGCLDRGMNIEMHCYGQGSQAQAMRAAATGSPIFIHDAIPYPELVKVARTFDMFICCHIQSDPSCTYLESFGAGLPIAGYDNDMWKGLLKASGAGVSGPLGTPKRLAAAMNVGLEPLSRAALAFARQHTFEVEFQKRIDAINVALAESRH